VKVKYDSYKDSGVEWIGEIPKIWKITKIKHHSKVNVGLVINPSTYFDDFGTVPIITGKNVTTEGIDISIVDHITKTSNDFLEQTQIYCGDIVSMRVGYPGRSCVVKSEEDGYNCCSLIITRKSKTFDSKLLNYILNSNIGKHQVQLCQGGMGQQVVNLSDWKEFIIPTPDLTEQEKIVSFLDKKTSLIDTLIENTQRKIELLKEKRTSLINHVVTKGLNPNVEYKDSGVEWIGEIPCHWEKKKLKYISDVYPSNVDKHIFPDEIQVRLCNYTDVYYNDYIDSETELKKGSCNENEFDKFKLKKDDVIITKDSESPDDIGVPTLIKDELENVVCGYHLTLIRPVSCVGSYIYRFIQSDRTRCYFEVNSNGITRFGLGKSSIENLLIPTPSESEQYQIVEYLNDQTSIIDNTITEELKRIELLQEYRQSLISEVVTGKIKVTNDE
jgi:type I restriction enzyme, S subunit